MAYQEYEEDRTGADKAAIEALQLEGCYEAVRVLGLDKRPPIKNKGFFARLSFFGKKNRASGADDAGQKRKPEMSRGVNDIYASCSRDSSLGSLSSLYNTSEATLRNQCDGSGSSDDSELSCCK